MSAGADGALTDTGRHRSRRRRRRHHLRRRAMMLVGVIALLAVAAGGVGWLTHVLLRPEPSARYEDALMRFEQGDYRGAATLLEAQLAQRRDDVPSLVLAGRAYLRLGYPDQAEQLLRQAQQYGAHPGVVTEPLARAYLLQGKLHQLVEDVPATAREPELRGRLLLVHGQAHLLLSEFQRALESFEQAAALLPAEAAPLIGRARVLRTLAHLDEARLLAAQAVELAPDDAAAWAVSADIALAAHDPIAALEALDRAVALAPGDPDLRLARAYALILADRDDDVPEELDAARATSGSHDGRLGYLEALLYAKRGALAEARGAVERAALGLMGHRTEFVMRDAPSLLLTGVRHLGKGSADEAAPPLERLTELEPASAVAHKLLAIAQVLRERRSAALAALARARELDDGDPEIPAIMALVQARGARYGMAAELLGSALDISGRDPGQRTTRALTRLTLSRDPQALLDGPDGLDLGAGGERAGALIALCMALGAEPETLLETVRLLAESRAGDLRAVVLHAALALRAGDDAQAAEALTRARALASDDAAVVRNLARYDAKRGDAVAAVAALRALLERDPGDPRTAIALADIASGGPAATEALAALEAVVGADEAALGTRIALVRMYLDVGRVDAAGAMMERLEAEYPSDSAVRLAAGRLALAQGRHEQASAAFRESSAAEGGVDALHGVALQQLAANDVDGARETLGKVVERDPGFEPAYEVLVDLWLRSGDARGALEVVEALRVQRPDSATGDRLHADVLAYMGRYAEAVAACREALRKSDDARLLVQLYRNRVALGEIEEVVAELEQWAAAHPDTVVVERSLADGYLRLGRVQPALEALERLAVRLPDDAQILSSLARLHVGGDDSRALELAQRAYGLDAGHADTLDTLGWVLVSRGDVDTGLRYLRDAQNRAVREPRIRYHLAEALSRLGRVDEARRELRRALAGEHSFEGRAQARQLLTELGG